MNSNNSVNSNSSSHSSSSHSSSNSSMSQHTAITNNTNRVNAARLDPVSHPALSRIVQQMEVVEPAFSRVRSDNPSPLSSTAPNPFMALTQCQSFDEMDCSSLSDADEDAAQHTATQIENLHQAIQNNNQQEITRLFQNTAGDRRNRQGYSPLMTAVTMNRPRSRNVRQLLGLGADPNLTLTDTNQPNSALAMATRRGHFQIVKILLDNNADFSGTKHNNLLHRALDNANKPLLQLLISHFQKSINNCSRSEKHRLYTALTDKDTNNAKTPFQRLIALNHLNLAEQLFNIEQGRQQGGEAILHDLITKFAADQSHPSTENIILFELLIKSNIDFAKKDSNGHSPLRRMINLNLPDILIDRVLLHAPVRAINSVDRDGKSALHQAVVSGNYDMMDKILATEGVTTEPSAFSINLTPLQLAVNRGDRTATSILLEYNANLAKRDQQGMTPLHKAVKAEHNHIISLLVEYEAPLSYYDHDGYTPLHLAATIDNPQGLSEILKLEEAEDFIDQPHSNPDIQIEDFLIRSDSHTPLQLAVVNNLPDNIKILLEKGANTKVTSTEEGRNILDLARFHHSNAAFRYLLQQNLNLPMRNDQEGVHENNMNLSFKHYLNKIKEAVAPHPPHNYSEVYTELKALLQTKNKPEALRVLEFINQTDQLPVQHLPIENTTGTSDIRTASTEGEVYETEQSVLTWVYTFIKNRPITEQSLLFDSLIHSLEESVDPNDQTIVCLGGRVNRLLDTFTGLLPGFALVSIDHIKHEMYSKAASIHRELLNSESQATQSAVQSLDPSFEEVELSEAFDTRFKTTLRSTLHQDYVESNIISEVLFNQILNEWIDII